MLPVGGRPLPAPRRDLVAAARDVLAHDAQADFPGWSLSHHLYGWTGVRDRDQRTLTAADLPGLKALMSVVGP